MSSQNPEPYGSEDRAPDLELNKETLQDLDVTPGDAGNVKGGEGLYGLKLSQGPTCVAMSELCAPTATGSVARSAPVMTSAVKNSAYC